MKKILYIIFYFIYITNAICKEQKPFVINYNNYYSYNNFSEFLDKEYNITNEDKKNITWIEIQGLNFSNSLPFTAIDFPNLEKLDITKFFVLYDLKGIESFTKLKSLKIETNPELPLIGIEFLNYDLYWPIESVDEYKKMDFSRIWQLVDLNELIIKGIPHFTILPNTISRLQNLKSLNIPTSQFLYNEIIQLPKIKRLTVSYNNEFLQKNMTYWLLKEYCEMNHHKIKLFIDDTHGYDSELYNNISEFKVPQDGKIEMYYKSGRKAVIGCFKNGYQDSIWTYWYDKEKDSLDISFYERKYNYFQYYTNYALKNVLSIINYENYNYFDFYIKNIKKNDTIIYYNKTPRFDWNKNLREQREDQYYIYYPSMNKAICYSYKDSMNYVIIQYNFLKYQQIIFNRYSDKLYTMKVITPGGEYVYTCKRFNNWTAKYERIEDTLIYHYDYKLKIFSEKTNSEETQNRFFELSKEMYKNMNQIMDSNLNIIKKEFEFLDTIQLNKPKVRFEK